MKKVLKIGIPIIAVILLCALLLTACGKVTGTGSTNENTDDNKTVSAIVTKKTQTAYAVGDDVSLSDLSVVFSYTDGTTSNEIAYSAFGNRGLTAKLYYNDSEYTATTFEQTGDYEIRITYDGNEELTATVDITVTTDGKVYAEEISLANSTTMIVSDTKTLSISYSPSTTTEKSVTWTSSDPSVVSVDQNGLLTAVKKERRKLPRRWRRKKGRFPIRVRSP